MRRSPPGKIRFPWVSSVSRRSSVRWSPSSAPHRRATLRAHPFPWMVAGSRAFSEAHMTHTLPSVAPASRKDVPPLAERVNQLSGEGALDVFRRATELERAGRSIVHLELGAPDVAAPPHVVDAAVAALRAGDARYVAPQGLPELREAIAADVRSRGIATRADQVIVTPSAKTAVFYAMMATIEPGSEVLVPDPGFPIYPSVVCFV